MLIQTRTAGERQTAGHAQSLARPGDRHHAPNRSRHVGDLQGDLSRRPCGKRAGVLTGIILKPMDLLLAWRGLFLPAVLLAYRPEQ